MFFSTSRPLGESLNCFCLQCGESSIILHKEWAVFASCIVVLGSCWYTYRFVLVNSYHSLLGSDIWLAKFCHCNSSVLLAYFGILLFHMSQSFLLSLTKNLTGFWLELCQVCIFLVVIIAMFLFTIMKYLLI